MSKSASSIRHLRPVQPVDFPSTREEWALGRSPRHLDLCTLLLAILRAAITPQDTALSDTFVYFDASDPRRCLAPDGFVKLGHPRDRLGSWKTWERGTPELCVEILSPSDTREAIPLEQKLERYRALGTQEVVCFDADELRIRAWDRIEGDLVEREVSGSTTPCLALGAAWVIAPGRGEPAALRLARDGVLVPTPEEAERAEKEAERAAKEAERAAKEAALAGQAKARAGEAKAIAGEAKALEEIERLRALLAERGGGR